MTISVIAADLQAASTTVADAGAKVRSGHGAEHLATAAGALPGSTSAGLLRAGQTQWRDAMLDWAASADALATSVAEHATDMTCTDTSVARNVPVCS